MFLNLGLVHIILSPYWTPLPHTACFPAAPCLEMRYFLEKWNKRATLEETCPAVALAEVLSSKSLSSDI